MVNVGFIGCHEISWYCLKKICELCLENEDELKIVFNLDVQEASKHSASVRFENLQTKYGFSLHNVSNVSNQENLDLLKNSNLDVLFIIGWHRIVPQEVLDTAPLRIGIHSSLLPKDRGSSPINWELIRGEKNGGVTLFHLTTEVDSGGIIDQEEYEISLEDDVKDVYFHATVSSLNLLEKNWSQIHNNDIESTLQDENLVTINERRKPDDGKIDWTMAATDCYNWIRALTFPYPGAFTFWNDKKVYLWKSKVVDFQETIPGEIIEIDGKIIISTGKNCLEIQKIQMENDPICNGELFTKSYNLKKNEKFS